MSRRIALLILMALSGAAQAQVAPPAANRLPPDVVAAQTPAQQPQPPVQRAAPAQPGYVAPAPFGALYNVLSGNQPPPRGQQQGLTPFNTP